MVSTYGVLKNGLRCQLRLVKWSLIFFWLIAFNKLLTILLPTVSHAGIDDHQHRSSILNNFGIGYYRASGWYIFRMLTIGYRGKKHDDVCCYRIIYFSIGIYHKFLMPHTSSDEPRNLKKALKDTSLRFSIFLDVKA